jgi:hypothetical protein
MPFGMMNNADIVFQCILTGNQMFTDFRYSGPISATCHDNQFIIISVAIIPAASALTSPSK